MTQTRMTTRLPTTLAEALATRAEANHRSVNGELCAILQAALSGTPEPVDYARDATTWGPALNDAGWEFIHNCPETSATLFNNTKAPLRLAILKYLELVSGVQTMPVKVEPKTFGERGVQSFIDAGIACPKCGNHPREHRPTCPMILGN